MNKDQLGEGGEGNCRRYRQTCRCLPRLTARHDGRAVQGSARPTLAREAANEVGDQVASATKDLTEVAAGAVADIVTGAARSLLPASLTGGDGDKRRSR